MRYSGRGYEDGGARRKLNHQLRVPENDMATCRGVEVTQGLDGTPSEWTIQNVSMFEGADVGAKVPCSAREDGSRKVLLEVRKRLVHGVEVFLVVRIDSRSPESESSCRCCQATAKIGPVETHHWRKQPCVARPCVLPASGALLHAHL